MIRGRRYCDSPLKTATHGPRARDDRTLRYTYCTYHHGRYNTLATFASHLVATSGLGPAEIMEVSGSHELVQPIPTWESPIHPTTFTSLLPVLDDLLAKLGRIADSGERIDGIEAGKVVAESVCLPVLIHRHLYNEPE